MKSRRGMWMTGVWLGQLDPFGNILGRATNWQATEKIMKVVKKTWLTAIALLTLVAIPLRLAAQGFNPPPYFKFVDLGTLGGPQSSMQDLAQVLNNHGVVVGLADTTEADPNYPNFNPLLGQDMFIQHATVWVNGVAHDLGTLPGGYSSFAAWISDKGLIAGIAENGSIDPVTGWPATDAVGWKNGKIRKLGTLGGNQAGATAVNEVGQAVGFAANTIPDQYSFGGWGTQTRAFLSQGGVMQDLGTLGGPDAAAWLINQSGQIAGQSYINSNPNGSTTMCGSRVPTVDAFVWEKGKGMIDLPSLGGTCSAANGLNNNGQVAGMSYVNAITYRAVLWSKGSDGKYGYQDLGDFGGRVGQANWINDTGEVVGYAADPHQSNRAFLWINGELKNLGILPGDTCSGALGINSRTQVIGISLACTGNGPIRPFLWERSSMYDLSTAFPAGYFKSAEATFINERGEVAGNGVLTNDDLHAFVLIPCKAGTDGCKPVTAGAAAMPQVGEASRDPSSQTQAAPGIARGYRWHTSSEKWPHRLDLRSSGFLPSGAEHRPDTAQPLAVLQ